MIKRYVEVKFLLFPLGEVRNDFYVTLKSAEFDRGNKTAQKNIEVKVTVYDREGHLIQVNSSNLHRYICLDIYWYFNTTPVKVTLNIIGN